MHMSIIWTHHPAVTVPLPALVLPSEFVRSLLSAENLAKALVVQENYPDCTVTGEYHIVSCMVAPAEASAACTASAKAFLQSLDGIFGKVK